MNQTGSQVAAPVISWQLAARAQYSAEVLSWEALAGLAIGVLMIFGFFPHVLPGLAGAAWRLSCLAYALLCLARGADRRQAMAMVALFVPFMAGVAIDAAVLHSPACLADFARQVFIISLVGVVFAAARDPVARRVGLWALFVVALAILADALVRALPALSSGWSYAAARTLKGKSFLNGYNANEVCFAALVALIAGLCDRIVPRWLLLAMMALVGLCSAVLTARAPMLALAAGVAGGWVIARPAVAAACARHRWLGAAASALVIAGVLAVFVSHIDAIAHSAYAVQLAGRAALWQVAIRAWPQQPLCGFGPGSFQAVIHANLGKAFLTTPDQYTELYQLQAGGFHNLWLSALVERGAIGLAGLFASWCLLLGFALHHGGRLPGPRRLLVFILLVTLFLRGQVELAGLFDDAGDPIDAIVMIAIGLSFPQASIRPAFRARDLAAQAAAAQAWARG
jgi:O-antigen ligase